MTASGVSEETALKRTYLHRLSFQMIYFLVWKLFSQSSSSLSQFWGPTSEAANSEASKLDAVCWSRMESVSNRTNPDWLAACVC